jgi:hypothetical protein
MQKIMIAVPSLGDIDMSTTQSLVHMIGYSVKKLKVNLAPCFLSSSLLPDLRNEFVKMAIESNCTHILFIDADMKFPHDMLERLLAHNVDIVTTNYSTKSENHAKFTATGKNGYIHKSELTNTGLTEILLGATGTMLIDLKVFKKLKMPYFWLYWDSVNKRAFGEDYYFCYKAHKAGFKIYIDNDLTKEVFHIGRKEYTINDAIRCYPEYLKIVEKYGVHAKSSFKGNNSKVKRRKRSNRSGK